MPPFEAGSFSPGGGPRFLPTGTMQQCRFFALMFAVMEEDYKAQYEEMSNFIHGRQSFSEQVTASQHASRQINRSVQVFTFRCMWLELLPPETILLIPHPV